MLTTYLIAALAAAVTQEPEIHGRLVDAEGRPMGDVVIAQSWTYPEPRKDETGAPVAAKGGLMYVTDENGLFVGPLAGRNLPNVLFAIDVESGLGRTIVVREPGDLGDLVMEPLASLNGSFRFQTAGPQPGTAGAWLMLDEGGSGGLSLYSLLDEPTRAFAFQIPAGRYRLHYSTDLTNLYSMPPTEHRPRLAAGQALDLGTIEIELPDVVHVRMQVQAPDGTPAERATAATFWAMDDGQSMMAFSKGSADEAGALVVNKEVFTEEPTFAFLVFDRTREHGALVELPGGVPNEPIQVRLDQLVQVRGELAHAGREGPVGWTNVYVYDATGEHRLARCISKEGGHFEFRLPLGEYRFSAYSAHAKGTSWALTLSREEREMDMGVVHLDPSASLELVGKPAPAWTVGAVRGLDEDPSPADFAGRYLLLEFWGHW